MANWYFQGDVNLEHGKKVVLVFHIWAKNYYDKLVQGLKDRDPSLLVFLRVC